MISVPTRAELIATSLTAVAVVYAIAMFYLNAAPPTLLLPDELWFVGIAQSKTLWASYTSFDLKYGGAFWLLLTALTAALPIAAIKAVFVAVLLSPLLLAFRSSAPFQRTFSVLLWFALPTAVWFGKVISPDTISFAICVWSVFLILRNRPCAALFLLGAAIGIKITAFAALPTLFILACSPQTPNRISYAITSALCLVIGIVATNPIVLLDTSQAFQTTLSLSAPSIGNLISSATTSVRTWDLVYTAGPLHNPISIIGYALLIVAMTMASPRVGIAIVATVFASAILNCNTSVPFVWYWFPLFAVIFTVASNKYGQFTGRVHGLAFLGVAFLLAGNVAPALEQLQLMTTNREHSDFVATAPSCLSAAAHEHSASGPVYIRSFSNVEAAAVRAIPVLLPQGSSLLVDAERHAAHARATFIVDAEVVRTGMYPALVGQPTICDGRFYIHPIQIGNR